MTTARRELPHIITPSLKGDALIRAIQANFDALSGEVAGVNAGVARAFNTSRIEAIAEETVNNTEMSDEKLKQALRDSGVGEEDGSPPPQVTSLRAVGGISNWFQVIFDGVVNTSPVTYDVHVHTTTGFAHAANTYVGSFTIPGGSDKSGMLTVRSFPSGHVLFGAAIVPTTTYYVKVVATDGDGEGVPSAQVTVSPIVANAATMIAAGTIIGDDLIVGNSISGNKIVGQSITGEKISGGTIDAITITSATINAGNINGVNITGSTITGNTIRTASSAGIHVVLSDPVFPGDIIFKNGAAVEGRLRWDSGNDRISLEGDGLLVQASSTQLRLVGQTGISLNGNIGFYGVTPIARQQRNLLTGSDSTTAVLHSKLNGLISDLQNLGLVQQV